MVSSAGAKRNRPYADYRIWFARATGPDPDAVESYTLASGETDHKGARRLREFYAGILAGRRFRDYCGRVI
jgi:hypothetical protein